MNPSDKQALNRILRILLDQLELCQDAIFGLHGLLIKKALVSQDEINLAIEASREARLLVTKGEAAAGFPDQDPLAFLRTFEGPKQ